jgi:hypothetical protein
MRPLPVVLTLLLVAALAGCTAPPGPAEPTPSAEATTGPSASASSSSPGPSPPWSTVYAGRLLGYGFIGPDKDGYGPSLHGVAVDAAGDVLAFEVAYKVGYGGTSGNMPSLVLDAASEPYRAALAQIVAPGTVYPADGPTQLRIRETRELTLSGTDWSRVNATLHDGLAQAREPTANQGGYVADGGSTFVGAGGRRVTLDDNHDRGGGWGTVEDQLVRLRSWMDGDGAP